MSRESAPRTTFNDSSEAERESAHLLATTDLEKVGLLPSLGSQWYFSLPWSPSIYFSRTCAENFHIVLWTLKDLAWIEDIRTMAVICGSAALLWCAALIYHAVADSATEDVYMLIPLVMWLSANYVWMIGNVIFNEDYTSRFAAACIIAVAIIWILVYHVALKPHDLIRPDKQRTITYEKVGLICRFSYFESWRQYEYFHNFTWLAKDLCWTCELYYLWPVATAAAILVAIDMLLVAGSSQRTGITFAHYFAQLLWLIGNSIWAIAEIYLPDNGTDDWQEVKRLFSSNSLYSNTSQVALRYYASWILFIALWPIIILHFIWIPLSLSGKISPVSKKDGAGL